MKIVIMLYEGITALDAIMLYEVFNTENNNNIKFLDKTSG
ncbi:4-methyl-5(B-hydroxyethyl)-thiazole monophosphate biosynthesis protein [Bacillus albus]|uniref:4-methyl-5(B-hydroxyethyl)-thiazole monophosphate biosynthesis protein n=1 Tax=Bacillus albus TaxID=2026189 RepID=A0ABM7E848_9BACI|nr:4-methyl-5(B-hydroxyethyl)-thiazole monophosphate biosynthesis protein [Bacillus albus]